MRKQSSWVPAVVGMRMYGDVWENFAVLYVPKPGETMELSQAEQMHKSFSTQFTRAPTDPIDFATSLSFDLTDTLVFT